MTPTYPRSALEHPRTVQERTGNVQYPTRLFSSKSEKTHFIGFQKSQITLRTTQIRIKKLRFREKNANPATSFQESSQLQKLAKLEQFEVALTKNARLRAKMSGNRVRLHMGTHMYVYSPAQSQHAGTVARYPLLCLEMTYVDAGRCWSCAERPTRP